MSASNPRKFKDRIALLHQKQAEGTAQFQAVMREVSEVRKPPPMPGMPGMAMQFPVNSQQQMTGDGLVIPRHLSPSLPPHPHFARYFGGFLVIRSKLYLNYIKMILYSHGTSIQIARAI